MLMKKNNKYYIDIVKTI